MDTSPDSILINASVLLTLAGKQGTAPIPGGAIAIKEGKVLETGSTKAMKEKYNHCRQIIDARNCLVMPGFVDCHTHLVFGGIRAKEMEMRLEGASYLELLNAGGGIHATVKATKEAPPRELYENGLRRLRNMARHGTTSVEIKSGYGLEYTTEKKILEVINKLNADQPLDVVATYLGAHTIPNGTDREHYLKWLRGPSLREFKQYATYFDVFCEQGAFTREESDLLLNAAREAGYKLKIHAGQFNDLQAAGSAAKLGAVSADHLECVDDAQIRIMAEKNCAAVLMPGVPFFLQSNKYPDGRRLIDSGVSVALATDFNPGSCPSYSMQMMIALAVFSCGLTISEAIRGATINAAEAIGLDMVTGSLTKGKKADIIILNAQSAEEIPYYFGTNLVASVMKEGKMLDFHPH